MRTQTQKTENSTRSKPVSSKRSIAPQYSHPVLQLQNQIGNQAVQRLLQSRHIQAKLTIGAPNDKYEQEADRVADQVMRMPDSNVQHEINELDEDELEQGSIQTQPLGTSIAPDVQRQPTDEIEEEELLQAKEVPGESPQVSNELEGMINSLRGGGQPLSNPIREYMEPRFGRDFRGVRVHTDAQASKVARSINARAFTVGQDIVFGSGQYSPGRSEGRRLLAHELTHTLQQRSESTVKRLVRRNIKNIAVLNSSQQIQRLTGAEIAGLGLAAFSTGRELATSGRLSHKSTPATYMHPGTPASVTWNNVVTTLHLRAWNPRYLIGAQHFYFRLAYDYNGYDIRNATINVLRNRSAGMYSSTFDITWSPGKHSRPRDPVAQVVFNISGQWDPVGRGDVSFWGRLVISAAQNGRNFESFTIGSERGYKGTSVRRG